jgi:Zn finger protein HypA/HybF involved in hydrogenase expression
MKSIQVGTFLCGCRFEVDLERHEVPAWCPRHGQRAALSQSVTISVAHWPLSTPLLPDGISLS